MKGASEESINKSTISKNQAIDNFKKALAEANNPTLIKEEFKTIQETRGLVLQEKKSIGAG
ncbi:hypothetical protein EJ377_01190 [Chryseobacterium arthrosphaerae]|uniref:Uncharacterized protein n=1 Tax=Chryseobacterium arthrosphaerae TaxID=651561 RepID=A0A3S0VIY1_9FLAO|nr:hypothetical protein EJ377_01190 [Chryseobacterium arthrosphaerae]